MPSWEATKELGRNQNVELSATSESRTNVGMSCELTVTNRQ